MAFDKDKFMDFLNEGASKVQKAASDTKDTVVAKYQLSKLNGELEDLYISLGVLVNDAYNNPGQTSEEEVAALNEKINDKKQQIKVAKSAADEAAGKQICPSCGKSCRGEYGFCPHCGAKMEEK